MTIERKANRPHAIVCDGCKTRILRNRMTPGALLDLAHARGWDLMHLHGSGRFDYCPQCKAEPCNVDPLTMRGPADA